MQLGQHKPALLLKKAGVQDAGTAALRRTQQRRSRSSSSSSSSSSSGVVAALAVASPSAAAAPGHHHRPRRRRRCAAVVASTGDAQVAVVGDLPAAADARARGPRAVVAVIDHTKASVRAVSWALANLYRDGDVLHLVHVVPAAAALANGLTQHSAEFDASWGDEAAGADLLERARAGIERVFVERCVAAGATVEVAVVAAPRCGGDAACCDLILGKVAELRAAVVVMPEQRQTLFESLFFRPVSQQVAARCPAPTVLIR